MKQATGVSASLGAVLSSFATISCCLPLGLAAALGSGAASALLTTLRPWLLGLSLALIGLDSGNSIARSNAQLRAEGFAWCCSGPG
jgi:hypothetical protein